MENQEITFRIRKPEPGQLFGTAIAMLGASRLRVECEDGKTRMVRIPGKLRKRVWVRIGDVVIVEPWKIQSDEKADLVWRYTKTQSNVLRKKGLLKNLEGV